MTAINLMTGEYTPVEAKEMLLKVIDSKINFYKIKNLSSQVSFEKPDLEAEIRINELKEAREQVIALIQEAKDANRSVEIGSAFNLALEAKEYVQGQAVASCN